MENITHLELSGSTFEGLIDKGDTMIEAGRGSLYEVNLCRRTCSAKRLSDVLQEVKGESALTDEEVATVAQRFRLECVSLSKLRHPNVLQFMGVHCGTGGPLDVALVMEHVHAELDQCLRAHPNMDLSIKLSVLFDVSCGLLYLHSRDPPVVHRNLTASNVVLTRDLTAKVADLRMSKVFDLETQMSRLPEGLVYMPPEAFARPPQYDVKMDVFSFGVLCLFVANDGFATLTPNERSLSPRNRSQYLCRKSLDRMDKCHLLYSLVSQCLLDAGGMRPTMTEVNRAIQGLSGQHERNFSDILKMVMRFEGKAKKSVRKVRPPPSKKYALVRRKEREDLTRKQEKEFILEKDGKAELFPEANEGQKVRSTKPLEKVRIMKTEMKGSPKYAIVRRKGPSRESEDLTSKQEKEFIVEESKAKLLPEANEGQMVPATKPCKGLEKVRPIKMEVESQCIPDQAQQVAVLQDRVKILEEEKRCMQTEMQDMCLELLQKVEDVQSEAAAVRNELLYKTQEVTSLQTAMQKQKDDFWVREKKTCIGVHPARHSTEHSLRRKIEARRRSDTGLRYEEVDSPTVVGFREENQQMKLQLVRLQDECKAYQEQSQQQKEQIQLYSSAADLAAQENVKLKQLLRQEEKRVEELLIEVNGLRRDTVQLSNRHQEEKRTRIQWEKTCEQLEAKWREEQLDETGMVISDPKPFKV